MLKFLCDPDICDCFLYLDKGGQSITGAVVILQTIYRNYKGFTKKDVRLVTDNTYQTRVGNPTDRKFEPMTRNNSARRYPIYQ